MRRGAAVLAVALLAAVACGRGDDGGAAPGAGSRAPGPSTSSSTSRAAATGPAAFRAEVVVLTAADLPASWRPGCPVPVEDLRAVDSVHWGTDGRVHQGRLVVAADRAQDVVGVLRDLFAARYPIERMEPIDRYGGSDEASVDANNTSAFNCRLATGSATAWSEHAYGRAVDLNPLVNPYVRGGVVLPPQSARFLDRTLTEPGMVHDGDPAVVAFESRGWVWGGHWRSSKDYQHFSTTGR